MTAMLMFFPQVTKHLLGTATTTMDPHLQKFCFPFRSPEKAAIDVLAADMDINNDGRPDVICSSNSSFIAWLRNINGSSFSAQNIIVTSGGVFGPVDALPVDLDNDGNLDIVAGAFQY